MTAIGCCGLQLYRFGETVSIPYWNNSWRPNSFYEKIISNRRRNLHTLCLLDIKVKEPTTESMVKKKKEYMPSQFMSVSEAATQLLEIIREKNEGIAEEAGKMLEKYLFQITLSARKVHGENEFCCFAVLDESSLVVGLARIGWDNQRIVACPLGQMASVDLGPPLHSLIVPAIELHPLESEFITLHTGEQKH